VIDEPEDDGDERQRTVPEYPYKVTPELWPLEDIGDLGSMDASAYVGKACVVSNAMH
jgi:hypothetical protein